MIYTQHPLSAAFPAMSAEEFTALKDSIGINGVLNPITIFEDMVIDGWHRYTAATESGVDCPSVVMDDSIDPIDFVKAQNENRRHLTASQRAAAIVTIYQWHPAHRGNKVEVTSTLSKTNAELAAIAKVSTKTIQQAKAAQKAGLIDPVKEGAMSAEEAAKIASGKTTPKPDRKPVAAWPVAEPEAEEPDYTPLDAALDQISGLQSELVVARMGDVPEDQKTQAAERFAELDAYIRTLEASLKAVTLSRDSLLEENAQMKKQMAMQRKEIDKLKNK